MPNPIISHNDKCESLESKINLIENRIQTEFDAETATQLIGLLHQLSEFELGQFLIQHGGLNGHWTHEIVTWSPEKPRHQFTNALEQTVLEKLPATLATRERFQIFQRLLQERLKQNQVFLSIPSGYMSEILLLDHSTYANNQRFIGIDIDQNALNGATELATQCGISSIELIQQDAWQLNLNQEIDILTSNGLNIYEHNDERVIALYQKVFNALKTGGQFITSFLTPPPTLSGDSSWKMNNIDLPSLHLQKMIFIDILQAKWSAYRTEEQTIAQLKQVGFQTIEIIYDHAGLFPTVIATK